MSRGIRESRLSRLRARLNFSLRATRSFNSQAFYDRYIDANDTAIDFIDAGRGVPILVRQAEQLASIVEQHEASNK